MGRIHFAMLTSLLIYASVLNTQPFVTMNDATALTFSQDAKYLFIGTDDGFLRVINLSSLKLERVLCEPGHFPTDTRGNDTIQNIEVSASGRFIAYTTMGKSKVDIFDLNLDRYHVLSNVSSIPCFENDNLYYRSNAAGSGSFWDLKSLDTKDWTSKKIFGYPSPPTKGDGNDGWAPGVRLWHTKSGIVSQEHVRFREYSLESPTFRDIPLPNDFAGEAGIWSQSAIDEDGRFATIDRKGNLFYAAQFDGEAKSAGMVAPDRLSKGTSNDRFVGYCKWSNGKLAATGNQLVPEGTHSTIRGVPCKVWDFDANSVVILNASEKDSVRSLDICKDWVAIGHIGTKNESARVDLFNLATKKKIASLYSDFSESKDGVRLKVQRY